MYIDTKEEAHCYYLYWRQFFYWHLLFLADCTSKQWNWREFGIKGKTYRANMYQNQRCFGLIRQARHGYHRPAARAKRLDTESLPFASSTKKLDTKSSMLMLALSAKCISLQANTGNPIIENQDTTISPSFTVYAEMWSLKLRKTEIPLFVSLNDKMSVRRCIWMREKKQNWIFKWKDR